MSDCTRINIFFSWFIIDATFELENNNNIFYYQGAWKVQQRTHNMCKQL